MTLLLTTFDMSDAGASPSERAFVLAPHVEIGPASAYVDQVRAAEITTACDAQALEGKYALFNSFSKRLYLVKDSIRLFLTLLEEARTKEELVEAVAERTAGTAGDVRGIVLPFLKRMRKRGFVFPKDEIDSLSEGVAGFEPGDRIGPYRVDAIFKQHRWTTVARAHAEPGDSAALAEGKPVVLKILHPPSSSSKKTREKLNKRFEKEFEHMAVVADHPAVCSLLDVALSPDPVASPSYAVIEYIEGGSLRCLINEDGHSFSARVDAASQVLEAIAHLHGKGLLHGDIHASNFIVAEDGTVKLIDFGLAARSTVEKNQVVHQGGVTRYIPPERVTDETFRVSKEAGTPRSEVFQVGVVLYGLLQGKLPFYGVLWKDLVRAIREDAPAPLVETPEGDPIPDAMKRVVGRALSKNPGDRFASAVAMKEAWRQVLRAAPRKDAAGTPPHKQSADA